MNDEDHVKSSAHRIALLSFFIMAQCLIYKYTGPPFWPKVGRSVLFECHCGSAVEQLLLTLGQSPWPPAALQLLRMPQAVLVRLPTTKQQML